MQTTDYIWHNGKIVPWHDATVHVLTHALHYGSAVFEGIRTYHTEKGSAVFRLAEHIARLFYSASVLKMTLPYTETEIANAIKELIKINKLNAAYIRPIAFYGYGKMGVNPVGASVDVAIACWPWGAYIAESMANIKTSNYLRISPRTHVPEAKISGNYLNSILASLEIRGTHYHEVLLLDTDNYIAEGAGENFFMVKDNIIYTPSSGSILPGITRDTLITIATNQHYQVIEKSITLEDAYAADEAFFTGTAAEVTPIKSIDDKNIGSGTIGPVTHQLRQMYLDSVHGKNKNYESYLTYI